MYTADPYHALAPAASYGVGAVVSGIFFLVLFLIFQRGERLFTGDQVMKIHPEKLFCRGRRSLAAVLGSQLFCTHMFVCAVGKEPGCRISVIMWSCTSPSTKEMAEE